MIQVGIDKACMVRGTKRAFSEFVFAFRVLAFFFALPVSGIVKA